MKIQKFQNREDWEAYRKGKLTGSRVKDLLVKRGTKEKIGYYELIAEKLATKPDGENAMFRGSRLEEEALERFTKETKKKLNTELIIWQDEEIPQFAISPDAYVDGKVIKEAVEVKCLASARHIEALITKKIPDDYVEQVKWYFIINPTLTTLYLTFYDPRMVVHDFFYLTITRKDFEDLDELRTEMINKIKSIEEQIELLTKDLGI